MPAENPLTIVGVGASGWAGLSPRAREALTKAEVLLGSERQLDLVPPTVTAQRVPWPRPLRSALPELLERHTQRRVCVLASGDPMTYGIGGTLARLVGPERLHVLPHPSAVTLACARMGWASEQTAVVSAVARPLAQLRRVLAPGQRVLVLSEGADTPAAVAELLRDSGFGASPMTVLADLDGPAEQRRDGRAETWAETWSDIQQHPLNIVAVTCAATGGPAYSTQAGLPDEAYVTDGQLTKREIRALTLARLAPLPGQTLWDIGAGSGSVAIEWMRTHPTCRAIAVERDPRRAERIITNAHRLGVPELAVHTGSARTELAKLTEHDQPEAIFVGGGASDDEVLTACWAALPPGGRMVVNAVTLAAEARVIEWQQHVGGELTRLAVQRAQAIDPSGHAVSGHAVWRPALPITQWIVERE